MSKKAYSSKDIIDLLIEAGFELDRIKGSHHVYYHPINKKRTECHILKKIYHLVPRGQYLSKQDLNNLSIMS